MTYQTAYKLLVAAYKSAKGIMPEGLDLLKIKQKARQKVIDAKKVIEFPKERITNPFKPRPTETEIMMRKTGIPVTVKGKTTTMTPEGILKMLMGKGKGKVAETEAEMLKRMNRQNKESVARLKEKKEKSLGEKLKDYDGDPDAMADGGKVKKPFRSKVVDFLGGPAVVGAELGLSGLLEVYNLLGMPLMKDGGIMKLATGGMTNISDTYDNNPTLQSQYPNKQDYLDLFAQQTTTTPQYATAYQSTGSIDPINPIKPIIKIPQSDGGDGGGGITRGGPNRFDYGYTSLSTDKEQGESAEGGYRTPGTKANEDFLYDIGVGTIPDEDYGKIEELKDTFYGIKDGIKDGIGGLYDIAKYVNPLDPTKLDIRNIFNITKKAFSKKSDKIVADKIAKEKEEAKAKAVADALKAQRDRLTYSGPAFTNQDGSTISQDFSTTASLDNYDASVLR